MWREREGKYIEKGRRVLLEREREREREREKREKEMVLGKREGGAVSVTAKLALWFNLLIIVSALQTGKKASEEPVCNLDIGQVDWNRRSNASCRL